MSNLLPSEASTFSEEKLLLVLKEMSTSKQATNSKLDDAQIKFLFDHSNHLFQQSRYENIEKLLAAADGFIPKYHPLKAILDNFRFLCREELDFQRILKT